jgi:hypothetical protein
VGLKSLKSLDLTNVYPNINNNKNNKKKNNKVKSKPLELRSRVKSVHRHVWTEKVFHSIYRIWTIDQKRVP